MNTGVNILAESSETGATGIYHLKRLWSKIMAGGNADQSAAAEAALDTALLNILSIGLLPAYNFLYEKRPDFETFEKWVASHHNGLIPDKVVQECNALFISTKKETSTITENVLSANDFDFWNTHGYVIVRNAISQEDCAASRNAIWEFLGMHENEPASWYTATEDMQGIMVKLYRHPILDKNRASPVIRKAFEQIWRRTDLIVTTDKTGFNPPETAHFKYRGTGLHWDVSLAPPIPFGVQGILYLTDTKANQGALTLVPGFHHKLEQWLADLPADRHPRNEDLTVFGPVPVAANAGDFIIWNHALPHSSSPNTADTPRIVQYMYWYPPMQEMQQKWI